MSTPVWFVRLGCTLVLLAVAHSASAQLVINEVEYDEAGTDTAEYIELKNNAPTAVDLSTYSLVFINAASTPASTYRTLALGPGMLAPGAYYVICANSANTPNCNLDSTPDSDWIQNGAPDALQLRQGSTLIDSLSYEGVTTGFSEGSAGPADTGSSAAQGLSRCPDGADTNDNGADFKLGPNTPAAANSCGSVAGGPLGNCGDPATNIAAIQGSGLVSGMAGASVIIEGVVVGDFQGASPNLNGFYVQEEDSQQDGDPNTSDGMFVYQGANTTAVSAGQLVRVAGTVTEFDGTTEISPLSAMLVCPSAPAATPRALNLPVSDVNDFERYEGMAVQISQTLTVTGNFGLGRYGSLDLSVNGRLYEPTHVATPGAEAIAQQNLNDRSRIILDDASSQENPAPMPYKDANHTRRVGDSLPSLSGVLDQRFGAYRIQPTAPPTFASSNPRQPAPNVPGRLRVASANVLNYFTTLDDGSPHCGPTGALECRGANDANELTRQRSKLINMLSAIDADVYGLMELQNSGTSAAVADLVSGLNAAVGGATYAYIDTGFIGTDAIEVGIIYKPAKVTPLMATPTKSYAILDAAVDPRFIDTKNRPVLAQSFQEKSSDARFTLVVNHWKSKGSDCTDLMPPDPDLGDGAGNCNRTRTQAAQALIDWLASDPTHSGDQRALVVGDFNAYAKEQPITSMEAAGYASLIATFIGSGAYSYQFDGASGYLDHAFASRELSGQVAGIAEWHSNADEPVALDYNTEFKVDDPFKIDDPYRASDHDSLVVGLNLAASAAVPMHCHWPLSAAGLFLLSGLAFVTRRE